MHHSCLWRCTGMSVTKRMLLHRWWGNGSWRNSRIECYHPLGCSAYVNWHFRGMQHFHVQSKKSAEGPDQETSVQSLPNHLLHTGFLLGWFSPLKMETIHSSETSAYMRTTRRCIPEDGDIRNYFCENVRSCSSNRSLIFSVRSYLKWQNSHFGTALADLSTLHCSLVWCMKFRLNVQPNRKHQFAGKWRKEARAWIM
jgi:hypothetical protein